MYSARNLLFTLFFAIALLIGAMRFYALDQYPMGFSGHAVTHAELRIKLYNLLFNKTGSSNEYALCETALGEQHGPQSTLEALSIPLLGSGFVQARTFVACLGILSLVAVFFLGKTSLNILFGFILFVLVGVNSWHHITSRYGDSEHVLIFLHAFFLLWALVSFIKYRSWAASIFFGLMLGLSFYVYATNQFLIPIILTALIIERFFASQRIIHWLNLLMLSIGFALSSFPQFWFNYHSGKWSFIRSSTSGYLYEPTKWHDLPDKVMLFARELFVMCSDPWFSNPSGALIELTYLLALPGFAWFFIKSIKPEERILKIVSGLLLVLGALPSIMTPEVPFRRMALFYIGLMIVSAVGAMYSARFILRKVKAPLSFILLGLLAVPVIAHSVHRTFVEVNPYESASGVIPMKVAQYIHQRGKLLDNIYIFFASQQGPLEASTFDRFIWFEVFSPLGHVRTASVQYPEIFLDERSLEATLRASNPETQIIVPVFLQEYFQTLQGKMESKGIFLEKIHHLEDRQDTLAFIVRKIPK